jgi:hypothetical protein
VAGNTEQLVNSATSQIEKRNKATKETLNKTINASTTSANTSSAITNLTDEYAEQTEGIVKSYITGNAQTKIGENGDKMWENPYDELYNLNQDLNATIREREKLERKYERAVNDSALSAQDLANITGDQLKQLKEEAELQGIVAQTALDNINSKIAENSDYENLYTIDTKTGTINVDWEAIDDLNWNDE